MGQAARTRQAGGRGRAGRGVLFGEGLGQGRWGRERLAPPGSGAAFLRSSPGGLAAAPARRSERGARGASSQRARRRPWRCRGPSDVGALSVGRGAGARGVVEAVFAEGLGVPRAADDDAATEEAEGRADPARVQRVAEAHDGGLAVGADGEPDGGHDAAHGWGDRRGESLRARPHADHGHTRGKTVKSGAQS